MTTGKFTSVKKTGGEKKLENIKKLDRSSLQNKKSKQTDSASVGTLGGISFFVKSLSSGKRKALGLSDIAINSIAQFEEHGRNGKKAYLEFIAPGLDELSFNVYASAQYGVKPLKIKKTLDTYRKKGTPNNFVLGGKKIGDTRWVITSIQSNFTVIFSDGRPVAITFAMTLKEYPNAKKKKKKVSTKNNKKKASNKSVKKTSYIRYVVQLHDTLWGLAVKYYGSGLKYTKIFNANKKAEKGFNKITDPNKIYVGWVIKIPK